VEGGYGTLSEMALGLKVGRPVIALGAWPSLVGVRYAETPLVAVEMAFAQIKAASRQAPEGRCPERLKEPDDG
ncbi:MAG: hypothetical protein IH614_08975, partial [Desulfuromonadales bacterium]|nr:hypothetical protein [Desulfuromonadales bacterium]